MCTSRLLDETSFINKKINHESFLFHQQEFSNLIKEFLKEVVEEMQEEENLDGNENTSDTSAVPDIIRTGSLTSYGSANGVKKVFEVRLSGSCFRKGGSLKSFKRQSSATGSGSVNLEPFKRQQSSGDRRSGQPGKEKATESARDEKAVAREKGSREWLRNRNLECPYRCFILRGIKLTGREHCY